MILKILKELKYEAKNFYIVGFLVSEQKWSEHSISLGVWEWSGQLFPTLVGNTRKWAKQEQGLG